MASAAGADAGLGVDNHAFFRHDGLDRLHSLGGDRLRVRISNAYGNRPLTIGAAQIALRDRGRRSLRTPAAS